MTEEIRVGLRKAFRTLNKVAEAAIRRELAEPIDLGHSERLQFEACPHFLGIKLIQTEEEIIPDSALDDAIPSELRTAAEDADFNLFNAMLEDLPLWFSERWQAVGGPSHYQPAYLLFHGGLDEPRYDLEQQRWCEVSEVWPEEA